MKTHKNRPRLYDGIVGLENSTYYCYMNACLQCLIPIDELRDHFIMQEYVDACGNVKRMKRHFDFCEKFHDFYNLIYSREHDGS